MGKLKVNYQYTLWKTVFPASIHQTSYIIAKDLSIILLLLYGKNKDRIKCSNLRNKLENGGLNMVDIGAFIIYLKINWIVLFLLMQSQQLAFKSL